MNTIQFTHQELSGQVRTHIQQIESPRFAAHPETVKSFLAMRDKAAHSGIDLLPFSSFRNLKTQIRIWNKKFRGEKPLYDIEGNVRDYSLLNEEQVIDAILGWSALPGASRHHWGSEIDVVDGAVMPQGYRVQLLPVEIEKGGLFCKLHSWLDENMAEFGFFRPYSKHQGGMYPEPWHLSHRPVSSVAQKKLTLDVLQDIICELQIDGKELVLKKLPQIYQQHIMNITE